MVKKIGNYLVYIKYLKWNYIPLAKQIQQTSK